MLSVNCFYSGLYWVYGIRDRGLTKICFFIKIIAKIPAKNLRFNKPYTQSIQFNYYSTFTVRVSLISAAYECNNKKIKNIYNLNNYSKTDKHRGALKNV